MKRITATLIGITILLSTMTYAQPGNIMDRLDDCSFSCSPQCERLVNRLQNMIDDVNYGCGFLGLPVPPMVSVKFFHSDNCSSSYLATINSRSNCNEMNGSIDQKVWAVEINGQCMNIADENFLGTCKSFINYTSSSVQLYKSDDCSRDLVAPINYRTNCEELSRHITNSVWAIKVNGQCQNISDTNFLSACHLYKSL